MNCSSRVLSTISHILQGRRYRGQGYRGGGDTGGQGSTFSSPVLWWVWTKFVYCPQFPGQIRLHFLPTDYQWTYSQVFFEKVGILLVAFLVFRNHCLYTENNHLVEQENMAVSTLRESRCPPRIVQWGDKEWILQWREDSSKIYSGCRFCTWSIQGK